MGIVAFVLICAMIGLFAGTMGGLLGVGGGIFLVPAFMRILGLSAQEAIGSSMLVVLFTSMAGSLKHYELGNLNLKVVLIVALLSMIGGYLGATAVGWFSEQTLRMAFGAFLMLVAVHMFTSAWAMNASSSKDLSRAEASASTEVMR